MLDTKYKIGDIVFLITDTEQLSRIVTGVLIRPAGIIYYLSCGVTETNHYEIEIVYDKNYSIC